MNDERKAFESAMKARDMSIGLRTETGYEDRIVQFAWDLWKARGALTFQSKEASKAVPVAELLTDAALAIRALVNSNERWGLTMFRKNAVAGADAVIERIEAALASQPEPTSKGNGNG